MIDLLKEIDTFCRLHRMPDSTFSRKATGEPAFVSALRSGRDPKLSTVKKCIEFMQGYKPNEP